MKTMEKKWIFLEAPGNIREKSETVEEIQKVESLFSLYFPNEKAIIHPTIFGIISPPFSTYTLSPSVIPNCRIKSSLCSVALCTIVPDNCTGSRLATGVTTPVRPT